MSGLRQEGILQVNDTGGGGPATPVEITTPIGQQVMADSVSVVIASNQTPLSLILPFNVLGGTLTTNEVSSELELSPTAQGAGVSIVNTGLTGTISLEASVDTLVWETFPFIDAGVIRTSRAFVTDSGSYNFLGIIPNGIKYLRIRMASHSAGTSDFQFVQTSIAPFTTWLGSVAPTVGQKTMAASLPVTIASDQTAIPPTVTNSGTMVATNDPVAITLNGHTGVGARVVASAGTFAGLVVIEASMDGGLNYFNLQFVVIASGSVVAGATFVAGNFQGSNTHHFSAILPAGITHARIRLQSVTAGSVAVIINGTSQLDFTQRFQGAYTQNPGPNQGLQLGGTATAGGLGEFHLVQVKNVAPGLSDYAIVVRDTGGRATAGGSAGSLQTTLVGGRDPVGNALRQFDIVAAAGGLVATTYQGAVVRPYRTSDGAGNVEPLSHISDAAKYVRDGHQALVTLSFKVFHEPAVNTQATITQATAGAGKRNICTGITVTLASDGTAPAAVQLYVRLRDGATGAGTVLWSSVIALTAVAGAMVNIERSNIWIEGSQNTAMTLEFSAAGGANTIETVSMEGVILTE